MRHRLLYLFVAVTAAASGCATSRPPGGVAPPPATAPAAAQSIDAGEAGLPPGTPPGRAAPRRLRPPGAQSVEQWSPALAEAMARQAAAPTVENEVALARTLAGLGIADQAFEHFARAARANPRAGDAWDGLARIWRDWGFPGLGLGDAYRSVSADPNSPVARNTLGTILEHLGHGRDARVQFSRALDLDSGAAYAYNNLCYSWLLEGRTDAAAPACRHALEIDPDLVVARNNLGLAKAMDGDIEGAGEAFEAAGGDSVRLYNLGIVCLAQGRYLAAAEAFDQAGRLQPPLRLARIRADQARQLALDASEAGRSNHEHR